MGLWGNGGGESLEIVPKKQMLNCMVQRVNFYGEVLNNATKCRYACIITTRQNKTRVFKGKE